jgi:hypothetical protein
MKELPPELDYASKKVTPLIISGIFAGKATYHNEIKKLITTMNTELFYPGVEILVCVPDSENGLTWKLESSRRYSAASIVPRSLNVAFQDGSVIDFPVDRAIRYNIMPDTKEIPLNVLGRPQLEDNKYVGIYFYQDVTGLLKHPPNIKGTPYEMKALLRKAEDSLPF